VISHPTVSAGCSTGANTLYTQDERPTNIGAKKPPSGPPPEWQQWIDHHLSRDQGLDYGIDLKNRFSNDPFPSVV
jgi:hypothetical protein